MHDLFRNRPMSIDNRLPRFNIKYKRTKQWLIFSNKYNRQFHRIH